MSEGQTHCNPDEIVDRMRAGDMDALDAMTRCYGARLLAVGRRRCTDEEAAQDAVQDALLAAGEHLQDFRGEGSLEGWLVRMVSNACYRTRRGRKNDPDWNRELDTERHYAEDDSPEEIAARLEVAAALDAALDGLRTEDRAILLLAEAADWTAPEIADAIGLSPGAIRVRLTRIRARLRPQLEETFSQVVPSE